MAHLSRIVAQPESDAVGGQVHGVHEAGLGGVDVAGRHGAQGLVDAGESGHQVGGPPEVVGDPGEAGVDVAGAGPPGPDQAAVQGGRDDTDPRHGRLGVSGRGR